MVIRRVAILGGIALILGVTLAPGRPNSETQLPMTHHYMVNVVELSGQYARAYQAGYESLQAIARIPEYQRHIEHYSIAIGEKPNSNVYVVSFVLLNSRGNAGCGVPRFPNGFPGVDILVRKADYKVVGRNFGNAYC